MNTPRSSPRPGTDRAAWQGYVFATIATVAMFLFRRAIGYSPGDDPGEILFLIPIILSAFLGGLGPGLFSTFLAIFGVCFVLSGSEAEFRPSGYLSLLAVGVLVSVVIAELRRDSRNTIRATELLRAVCEGTTDAVYVKDRAGKYLLFNPAAGLFVGKHPKDVIGRTDAELFDSASATAIAAFDDGVMESGLPLTQEENLTAAGTTRTYLSTKVPQRDAEGTVIGLIGIARDITDRKRAETELERQRAELRLILDTVPALIFFKDRTHRYVRVNAELVRLVGMAQEDIEGRTDAELGSPHAERYAHDEVEVMTTGVPKRGIEEPLFTSGGTRWLQTEKLPYRDATGQIVGVVGLAIDVTDRREATEALRRSEERFRVLADAIPQIVWTAGPDGAIDYFNTRVTEYTGFSVAELIGWSWSRVIHPDDLPHVSEIWGEVLRSGVPRDIEFRIRQTDGNYRGFIFRQVAVRDGETVVRWFGTGTDIHDLKQAEEALRLRDRAMQAVTQGILITDPNQSDNPIVYASPGFELLTGYSATEAVGRNCRFLQGEDTDPEMIDRLHAATTAGLECSVEFLNYRKDGTPFWIALHISPVRDASGRTTHFVGVQVDVTERKKLEDQLRQSQKMEGIGQLAGGVAHDFNNLLTVINGYSDMVLDRLPAGHPDRGPIEGIRSAGERAAGLTNQLLAFSRRAVLEPRILDPNAAVTESVEMLRRLIGEHINLRVNLDPRVNRVRMDPNQLGQILMNLAVNAQDAMPSGGRLTLETRNAELDENYARTHPDARAGRYVLITVSDTGMGMTEKVKARIFEPFFTTKGSGKGTGLGLAAVHGIVRQSGGYIEADSVVGNGTAFRVYLPAGATPDEVTKREDRGTVRGGTETILLVEDQAEVREIALIALRTHGYNVLSAASGPDALLLMETQSRPIDILVTDVIMPGMSGRVLAETLRQRQPGLKILYASGYTDDDVVHHGVRRAEVAFLHKPFTPDSLARCVREVLDRP